MKLIRFNSPPESNAKCAMESGQAMVEATLILSFFAVLMLCAKLTGSMQLSGLNLLRDTTVHAFSLNLGQKIVVNTVDQGMQRLVVYEGQDADSVLPGSQLLDELRVESPGRIKTISRRMPSAYPGVQNLYRQSYIEVGNGHANDDADVQRRITDSYRIWRLAHSSSSGAIKRMRAEHSMIDTPWNRAKTSSDWLDRWSGVVPDQKRR